MTMRTTSRTIAFRRPFLLRGFEFEQPAGAYIVDTEEELMESLSFPVWKRVATSIWLRDNGTTEYLRIDPADLDAACARDGTQTVNNRQEYLP